MGHLLTTAWLICGTFITAIFCQDDLCYEKVDILFVMDSSGSIGSGNFQKQLQFASTFVDNFHVGSAQFSVLRFDSSPLIIFDFNDYLDKASLKNAISKISYPGGGTDTAAALKLAKEKAFLPIGGARAGVPKIVIVLTDGQSNSPSATKIEAKKLKDSNVLVLSIGVGSNYNKVELDAIATYPEDTFEVINFDVLLSIVHDYSELICSEVQLFDCVNDADVFFLMDSSNKITPNSFNSERNFVVDIVSKLKLAEFNFGAVTFGASVQRLFNLSELADQSRIVEVISNAPAVLGDSDIDGALKHVRDQGYFEPASGGRVNATKILVALTDGGSSSITQAKLTAAQMRVTGIHIITVGVSNPNITDLQSLVNDPVLDVVTNLAISDVAVNRIQASRAYTDCKVPSHAVKDVSDACRLYNWENGIYPHPYNCTKYLECTFLNTDIISCPPGQGFDPAQLTCVLLESGKSCNGSGIGKPTARTTTQLPPTTIRLPPSTITVSDACRIYNWENGIHPHPYDCTKYIECTFLRTDIMPCAPGLGYDPVIQTCVLIENVKSCSGSDISVTAARTTTRLPQTTNKPCLKGRLDILLIIDSSVDVGYSAFGDELRFAANLAENFLLGESGVQFAALTFGSSPIPLFNFGAFTEYKALQAVILNATYQGGTTNTHLALESGLSFYTGNHGSRPGSPKVAIVFTNGRSSDILRTKQQAALLRQSGVYVFAVSVASPNFQELQDIASEPTAVFNGKFSDVIKAIQTYSDKTCNQDFVCKGIQLADVIFVLDSSASISDSDYKSQLLFVADVTDKFTLGPSDVRFGAVIFSQDTVKLFDLKDFNTHDILKAAILSAKHLKSGTDTAKALNFVNDQNMYGINAGGRDNATKILIVLTDGRSNSLEETERAGRRLKDKAVKVIAIGIGSDIYLEELKQLASDNQSLFTVAGYNALHEIEESVTRKTCDLPQEATNAPQTATNAPQTATNAPQTPTKGPNHSTLGPSFLSTTRSAVAIVITNVCHDFNLADGIYPDPGNCRYFVECTALITYHLACPEGLHYNTINQVCDDVHEVNCQINYDYFNNIG